jgi:hypothetical protein
LAYAIKLASGVSKFLNSPGLFSNAVFEAGYQKFYRNGPLVPYLLIAMLFVHDKANSMALHSE